MFKVTARTKGFLKGKSLGRILFRPRVLGPHMYVLDLPLSLLRRREGLQVRNAFLECGGLLVGGDGGFHVADDPVHHVLLLHAPQHIRRLHLVAVAMITVEDSLLISHLVVEPLLDGSVGGGKPAAVLSLQLQADGLLLGRDDVLPGGCLLLHTLLSLDLREERFVRGLFLME